MSRPAAVPGEDLVVNPGWLLKALGAVFLLAAVCGYATMCWLFHNGQWQLVLHPERTASAPPDIAGQRIEEVRFAPDGSGLPQLTAWWMPASPASRFAHLTVLYLPSGQGSLLKETEVLGRLHALGVGVFAVEYRGFGRSAAMHPSQGSMTEDADSAWRYLTQLRGARPERIVPYGSGLGAALAVHVATTESAVQALILDGPEFDVLDRVKRDPRSRMMPVNLLFHERFALRPELDRLRTPKLILTRNETESAGARSAAAPKLTVELPQDRTAAFEGSVSRFLDQYAPPTPVGEMVPHPAPPAEKQH